MLNHAVSPEKTTVLRPLTNLMPVELPPARRTGPHRQLLPRLRRRVAGPPDAPGQLKQVVIIPHKRRHLRERPGRTTKPGRTGRPNPTRVPPTHEDEEPTHPSKPTRKRRTTKTATAAHDPQPSRCRPDALHQAHPTGPTVGCWNLAAAVPPHTAARVAAAGANAGSRPRTWTTPKVAPPTGYCAWPARCRSAKRGCRLPADHRVWTNPSAR